MRQLGFYLEDDELLRMSAEFQAKQKGLNLKIFSNSKEFLNATQKASKEIFIFLDSEIGEEIRGEEVGKQCFEMGFKNIYLITSYEKEDFRKMPWIKEIGGKTDIFKFWDKLQ